MPDVAFQCVNNVEPLPPVSEGCLPPDQRKCLVSMISQLYDEPAAIEVLSIFQKCSSLRVAVFLLSSVSGRHHLSSIAFSYSLHSTERPKLVRVHYFANISYVVKQGENEILSSIWIARVNFFLEHPCRVWFGYPTEVWTSLESSESSFAPLNSVIELHIPWLMFILFISLLLILYLLLCLYEFIIVFFLMLQCIYSLHYKLACSCIIGTNCGF